MLSDFRYALRTLARAPGFAIPSVLTLALGIGVSTGAFTAFDALLLKPLPFPEQNRLVSLYETTVDGKPRGVAEANLLDWSRRAVSFEGMAAYQPRSFGLTRGDRDAAAVIQSAMVMADFFRVLQVVPAAGRTFTEEEEIAEAHLIVLTDRAWRRLFSDGSGAIGRVVALNEEPYTIIGIMPEGFEFPIDRVTPDLFIPLSRRDYCCGRLGQQQAIARVGRGVSLDSARAELASAAAAVAVEHPATNRGRTAGLLPLADAMNGSRREPLRLLMLAAVAVLLIASANAGGLIVARGLKRIPEMTVRAALGASPARMARQYLAEAVVLAVAGALGGLLAAETVLRLVPQFIQSAPLRLNASAFLCALGLAAVVSLLLALAPAGLTPRRKRSSLRSLLVVTQIALSVALLLAAGLLLRSFLRVSAVEPGFESSHALRFGIGLPEKRYDDSLKLIAFHRELLRRLQELPGVESAGAALRTPLRGGAAGPGGSFQIAGANIPLPERPRAWVNAVTPGYFETMRIPIVEGRTFSYSEDRARYRRVAVVNQTFARTYLRGRRALGTPLEVRWISDINPEGSVWEIVGVAGDARQASLDQAAVPEIFLSQSQIGAEGDVYVLRYRGSAAGLAAAVATTVAGVDPRLERVNPEPLERIVERSLAGRSAALRLIGGFTLLALLLTGVGLYGIVAFHAAGRSREIAIRAALGATAGEIHRLVVGHAIRLAAAGAVAGLAGFAAVLPLLRNQLYGVTPGDPVSLAATAAVVLAVALLASVQPSRRAARAEIAPLLRGE